LFCTECGANNQVNAKFCYQCGSPIRGGAPGSVEGGSTVGTDPVIRAEAKVEPSRTTVQQTPDLESLTIRINGVTVPIRKFVQEERILGRTKEQVVSRLVGDLYLSQGDAASLVEGAWNSVPQARIATEGAKNGLGILFGVLCVGGFFLVIGAILIGSLRSALEALGSGKVAAAGILLLIAVGVFLYAKWSVKSS